MKKNSKTVINNSNKKVKKKIRVVAANEPDYEKMIWNFYLAVKSEIS